MKSNVNWAIKNVVHYSLFVHYIDIYVFEKYRNVIIVVTNAWCSRTLHLNSEIMLLWLVLLGVLQFLI
jgi:hypothetical protein